MSELIGRRLSDNTDHYADSEPGDYWFVDGRPTQDGHCLWVKDPEGNLGRCCKHEVTEHEDGTVTVEPSILVTTRRDGVDVELFHGHLRAGVWTW